MEKYRHYGCTEEDFNPDYFYNGAGAFKPEGFWACRDNAVENWKDWCEGEDYKTEYLKKHFDFLLKPGAKILHIYQPMDVLPFCKSDGIIYSSSLSAYVQVDPTYDKVLDLDILYAEYDGMEVHMDDNWSRFHDSKLFYPWDVSSIVIWNLSVVAPIKANKFK